MLQFTICEPAMDSDIWELIAIKKSESTLGKIMIHMTKIMLYTTMNACVHFIDLILFNTFYKLEPCLSCWVTSPSLINNIGITNILLVRGHLCFMNLL